MAGPLTMKRLACRRGFTFIEVLIAGLIMTLLVAAVLQYHSSSGAADSQKYYLKAVETARSELDKLRALFELKGPSIALFSQTIPATPPSPPLLTAGNGFTSYTSDQGYSTAPEKFLVLADTGYVNAYNNETQNDDRDPHTLTYFKTSGDPAMAVIDDMGSPVDPTDDLLGEIGWWIQDVDGGKGKKICFSLQFWYPGQDLTADPEVITIKTLMVQND